MSQEPANQTTFAVAAIIGYLATGTPWPFGRLYVSDESITVRTFFREKTCLKSEISEVILGWRRLQKELHFVDAAGTMADVSVFLTWGAAGVVEELRRRGYLVTDNRKRRR